MKELQTLSKKMDLTIDAPLTVELIESYFKQLLESKKTDGLLLGLSGGIDSSVLITLAVRAVGKEKVHASFLFDRDSEKSSQRKAALMANWLGVKLESTDISPEMKKRNIYAPLIMKLIPYSALFNRMIQYTYKLLTGEVPFKTTLKIGSGEEECSWFKYFLYNFTIRHIERGFSERHKYRREVLEQKAKEENLTLIGAANRSESEIGWFVKDGIDDLPIQPMTGLYKTQVWQLASYLKLPDEIQGQTASPDMMFGINDEFGIGHNYRRLDVILNMIEQKLTDEEIIEAGISQTELDDVRELKRVSEWKRASEHKLPPVDGGIEGNVRLIN
ncbi:NAD(+) synthase [Sulfurimonas microaerophilic]|uniref:NAD(+) synthase n=1 Tax=Sulfurimonas microaerophilic TaxID=3058392 RepID=UPI002714A22F|nr:NAD(+) synthase [Sulfurimonas sp. hsl 1-7]